MEYRSASEADAFGHEGSNPSLGIKKIYGPYTYTDCSGAERRYLLLMRDDGRKHLVQTARYAMMIELGRWLWSDEHIHHIDEDPLNDDRDNIRLMNMGDHSRLHAVEPEWYHFKCPQCGIGDRKLARNVRGNHKKNRAGPFCSRSCAGKWGVRNNPTWGGRRRAQCGSNSKYRSGCRCDGCRRAHTESVRDWRCKKALPS